MTTVTSGEYTRRRYQWTVPVPFSRGAVVGDVRDAIGMAEATYEAVTGGRTSSDDWLRVEVGDEEVTFWFEVEEKPGPTLPPAARRSLQVVIAYLEDAGYVDVPALAKDLQEILRGGEVVE